MELEILQGVIAAVVYQNYDTGYAVLRIRGEDGQTVTVVGTIPRPAVGERLMITGKWSIHSSYGKQFEAEFLERLMPQTENEILSYLSSRSIKGIGPVTAARIVKKFGADALRIIEQEPEKLAEISGISPIKAKAIAEEFRLQIGIRQLLEFFAIHQLPADLAVRCYKMYGNETIDLLYSDPYLLMEEGLDAPFGAVDRFAIELGVAANDSKRIESGILFELRYNLNAGHSFLPESKLVAATSQLLNLDADDIQEDLDHLAQVERLFREELAGIQVCYLPELRTAERYCAQALKRFASSQFSRPATLSSKLKHVSDLCGITYSQQQISAIESAMSSGLLLITGGPGTGKTTILNGILTLFREYGIRTLLAAPTGRAAKRLTEITGEEASTIHRLLEATIDPMTGKMFFAKDSANPLKADAVIVDEMSMVDILLLYNLLQAIAPGKRLILVGDPDQLPPVGPGSPFRDCLRSGAIPTVKLTEIFRQAQKSLIVTNAHKINNGELPVLTVRDNDFFFLPCQSEEHTMQTIASLCTTRLPKNMGIPADQIQVLTPTRKGISGSWGLNTLLQSHLNPPSPQKKEKKHGEFTFREGDRVMQIRNNYDIVWTKTDGSSIGTGIFNGDIGTISKIDLQEETLHIIFDDKETDYDFSQLIELEPAYAMTVHKSQGSEYRAVILAAWSGSPYLLNRSILYTAVTRAKDLLIIVGQAETVVTMVANAKVGRRYTGLKLRLQEDR